MGNAFLTFQCQNSRVGRKLVRDTMAALGCLAPLACRPPPDHVCVSGGEPGKQYDVVLTEEYVEGIKTVFFRKPLSSYVDNAPSCGGFDGLDVGTLLPIEIQDDRDNAITCWSNRADVQFPPPAMVQPLPTPGGEHADDFTWSVLDLTLGDCTGSLYLEFRSPTRDAFATPKPEQVPPFLVYRSFETEHAESCPVFGAREGFALCEDAWVASITPR